jgi:DNA mismatch repair protein MutL
VCEIEDGGRKLIRVTDDGIGMSREDALLAVKRHATSKLGSLEDLLSIRSFGFRGEALPSIASISRLEMLTRQRDSIAGTRVVVVGGEVKETTDAGCPVGTSIAVRDLFFNVPVRRKFLKTTQTELYHLANAMTWLAISNPNVAFSMSHDGHVLFEFPPASSLKDRVLAVLGLVFTKTAVELNAESPAAKLSGFVSRPEEFSPTRTRQLIFVNKRPVSNRSVTHAIYQGLNFEGKDRHPAFLVMLEVPPNRVDVNVHPTKREVRMLDEGVIHDFIVKAVAEAVRPAGRLEDTGEPAFAKKEYVRGREPFVGVQESLAVYAGKTEEAPEKEEAMLPEFWQLHNTYILAQTKTGLVIVDQHTAHERILYEEILGSTRGAESQQLLFPRPVEFSPQESALLEEMLEDMRKLGFEIKKFSGNTFIIEAVPAYIENYRDETFSEFVKELFQAGKTKARDPGEIAKTLACKAAVKAGQVLTQEEMNSLVDRLFATKVPFFCPHGRPTVVRMSLEELGRRFGRL